MKSKPYTRTSLRTDLAALGVKKGDGLFVHGSMKAIGATVGGPRVVVDALLEAVGDAGLIGMPGFSSDAYFPAEVDASKLSFERLQEVENAVPGFDVSTSPTHRMGIIAETFRTWPGTERSQHPTVSICLNGQDAKDYVREHPLDWATGADTPLGRLYDRQPMKMLLIGVGWNRCSALHTAEALADVRRTKTRRFKHGGRHGSWIETPDVADDMNRLFPAVGEAFERTGKVTFGILGEADCRICDYRPLIDFACGWINQENIRSGDRH